MRRRTAVSSPLVSGNSNARIESVREALKGEDTGVVDSTKAQLAEVLQRIGTKAYEASTPGDDNGSDGTAGGAESTGEAASEEEGETIEGEYKEV